MPKPRTAAAAGLALALFPEAASAHSPVPGIEGFYVGLAHPLTSPAQVLALGLFFSQRQDKKGGPALLVFTGACFAGILLGQFGAPIETAEPGLMVVALGVGVMAALRPAGAAVLGLAAAGVSGLLIGLLSTPEPGPARATIITLTGTFVGAVVLLVYCVGGGAWLLEKANWSWVRIGFRIAAAWVAAIAALLLALRFSGVG